MLLTPQQVKSQKDRLKQSELEHFSQTDINSLISDRTLFCDNLLKQLWAQFELDKTELALVAVGGYGRKEMFPLSDLDFLILSEQQNSPELAQKISQFIQFLWDCGFDVGAAVRTLAECDAEGRKDITIATNLLESRLLIGNEKIFKKLTALLWPPDFWDRETFFNAKVQEKTERYQRYHNTSYNLEPDIKHSPGGLRDLHLIYWIALRHSNVMTLDEILQSGFIYPEEYSLLQESQQFLFKVRFALHLILKRYDNRLLFDRQIKVAELLGFEGEGNQGVERMMKRFFQALNNISSLSDLLTKHYREHFLRQVSCGKIEALDSNFAIQNNEIVLRNEHIFMQQPDTILDLFAHHANQPQTEIHSATLRKLHLALSQLQAPLSQQPLAREKFLRLFNLPKAIRRAISPMHKYGVLTAYLPQWKAIEGLMQFDLFHAYTVDEHTLRVLQKLESFLEEDQRELHPICARIFSAFSDRTLLYIAALFHDIAKGRGGDHAKLGAQDVSEFAQQHGFERREIETMAWLVEQHLLMSITAQRRDIHDPEVVLNFAEKVKNKVRLDLLICLTVADICATSSTLWNSWKRALFTSLYEYTNQQFAQGMDELIDTDEQVQDNKKQALALLQSQGFMDDVTALWARCSDDYFLRNTPKQLAWHATLLTDFCDDILVKISNRFSQGGTDMFLYCQDQAQLFHKVASTVAAKKFSIHSAQISTSLDGYVLDTFVITELNGIPLKNARRRELESAITDTLRSGKTPKVGTLGNQKLQHFNVQTEVRFLAMNRSDHTEMELFALDKAGLLAEVSQVFAELGLNLLNAKITTIGEKAEDFFMLTNKNGTALTETERKELEVRLKNQLN
ncbi:UTP--GlnB (protein PII) uridylyltransferase GlnD [Pasteurella langaaensis DSM 22999]|uniref:Bifunctional uridylyltransferase/uridylyl-removing enzyme n=1 Tax=Alitibacter langaaensis DSM 22999 TaxID=1122935 RepID=A0A2U0TAK2_9PAST|nr:bifunctional uridylyltransferase/uridylyl-removing protein GlnD [Pasteurella langaaensis]PVX40642.1 UTP--GlnB (protein PII) uridylyltransferase GlnD [Pasteurella langaaensis DSM 22999]